MGPALRPHVSTLLILCLLGGCTSVRPRTPFASRGSAANRTAQNAKPSGKNFFGKPASKAAEEAPAAVADKADASPAAEKTAETKIAQKDSPPAKEGSRDELTRALIEAELRDATPEERQQVFEELKGVDAEMVPQILSARRSALEYAKRRAAGTGDDKAAATSEIQQTAATVPAPDDTAAKSTPKAETAPAAALGTKSPWGTPGNSKAEYSLPPTESSSVPGDTSAATQRGSNTFAVGGIAQTANYGDGRQVTQAGATVENSIAGPGPGHAPSELPPSQASAGEASGSAPSTAAAVAAAVTAPLGNLIPGRYGEKRTADHSAVDAKPAAQPHVKVNGVSVSSNSAAGLTSVSSPAGGVPAGGDSSAASWANHLQNLTAVTETEVALLTPGQTEAERQHYIERHVYLRMLYLMSGQYERALQYIPAIEPADQEFWQQVFWGVANYFDDEVVQNPADRATQTVAQFNNAVLRLKEKANLELRNVTFCHTIPSYGNYERFPRDEFTPGQPVLLYVEVGNFHSELTSDGRYRTLLRSSIEILKPGPQGEVIEKIEFRPTEDLCRSHRRDYYHSYELEIPRKISLGPHVLKLTVEDQLSRKVASYTLNFTVK